MPRTDVRGLKVLVVEVLGLDVKGEGVRMVGCGMRKGRWVDFRFGRYEG